METTFILLVIKNSNILLIGVMLHLHNDDASTLVSVTYETSKYKHYFLRSLTYRVIVKVYNKIF
jgi:hypothetical protein